MGKKGVGRGLAQTIYFDRRAWRLPALAVKPALCMIYLHDLCANDCDSYSFLKRRCLTCACLQCNCSINIWVSIQFAAAVGWTLFPLCSSMCVPYLLSLDQAVFGS